MTNTLLIVIIVINIFINQSFKHLYEIKNDNEESLIFNMAKYLKSDKIVLEKSMQIVIK
jgi:hypothetical protein